SQSGAGVVSVYPEYFTGVGWHGQPARSAGLPARRKHDVKFLASHLFVTTKCPSRPGRQVADQNRLVACSTHPEETSMKHSGQGHIVVPCNVTSLPGSPDSAPVRTQLADGATPSSGSPVSSLMTGAMACSL